MIFFLSTKHKIYWTDNFCSCWCSHGLHWVCCDQILIQHVLCTQICLVLERDCPHFPSPRDCSSTIPVFHDIAFAFNNTLKQRRHAPVFKMFGHILRMCQVNEAVYERSVIASPIVHNLRLCFILRVGTLMSWVNTYMTFSTSWPSSAWDNVP